MTTTLFPAPPITSLPVIGEDARFPVARIFCVGRNYEAHAKEMGAEVDRETPFYFTKSHLAVCHSGESVPFPPGTNNLHHEMEFVMAIGANAFEASTDQALEAVYAYGCGLDMTRRDLQNTAKEGRKPWDTGKDFENSAVLGPLTKRDEFGPINAQRIWLDVNGETHQDANLSEMIWKADEIIAHLSTLYHLRPGDIIMTGTPAGVSAVQPGDRLNGGIEGLESVSLSLQA